MCKIMVIPHINNESRTNAIKFIEAMSQVLSKDKSHQDGLGYAGIDSKGNLFAERWLNNDHAFTNRTGVQDNIAEYSGFLKIDYNSYGDVKLDDLTAITLHTRLATSAKGLINCHPFIENDTSVIHNGVISNAFDFRIDQSTCDSESILTQYVDHGVGADHELFNKVSTQLDGYYACGIFSRDANGNRILDIVKSSSAQLVGAYVNELKVMVFTSLESHLREGLRMCGFTSGAIYSINPSSLVRLDPVKNKVIGISSFGEYERSYLKLTKDEMKDNIKKSYSKRSTYGWGDDWDYDAWNDKQNKTYADELNDPFYYKAEPPVNQIIKSNGEYIVKNKKKRSKIK
jgi:hypothetical protein